MDCFSPLLLTYGMPFETTAYKFCIDLLTPETQKKRREFFSGRGCCVGVMLLSVVYASMLFSNVAYTLKSEAAPHLTHAE